MPTARHAALLILPLTLGIAFAGCDQGTPSSGSSSSSTPSTPSAPAVAMSDVAGVREMHPGSISNAAYNVILNVLEKNNATATEAQIVEQAKAIEPKITGAEHQMRLRYDSDTLTSIPSTDKGREVNWRRK